MKVVLTGSLGHISKPLAEILLQKGHAVTIISSKEDKKGAIEKLGATSAIGSVENIEFLVQTFKNADAVYCMIPPDFSEADQVAYYSRVARAYAAAIEQTNIQRVIHLSSYGAHVEKNTGFILGAHHAEKILDALKNITVTHMRPGYFYYNLLNFVKMIQFAGAISANYGGNDRLLLVAPGDIAAAIAEELETATQGRKIRYVVSDDCTCNELATALGKEIGKPDLQWHVLTSDQMRSGLEANGVPKHVAQSLTEIGEAIHNGILREDYDKQPAVWGNVKKEDYAKEFAAAFNK